MLDKFECVNYRHPKGRQLRASQKEVEIACLTRLLELAFSTRLTSIRSVPTNLFSGFKFIMTNFPEFFSRSSATLKGWLLSAVFYIKLFENVKKKITFSAKCFYCNKLPCSQT